MGAWQEQDPYVLMAHCKGQMGSRGEALAPTRETERRKLTLLKDSIPILQDLITPNHTKALHPPLSSYLSDTVNIFPFVRFVL